MPSAEEYDKLKKQLDALSQEKADLETLRDLINKLGSVTGVENVVRYILTAVTDIVDSEKVTAYYRINNHCVSIDVYGKKNEFDCFDDSLVAEAIEKLAIIEKPSDNQTSAKKSDKSSSVITTLVFPLIVGDNVIGAVKIVDVVGSAQNVKWKLQPFINYFAVILNNEISSSDKLNTAYLQLQEANAKLQEEIKKHIEAEEQLEEKSDTLKTIFESIQIGVVIINPETHKIVYVNPFAVKMIRAPREKIVGAECHKFICPAEKDKCPVTDLGQKVDNSEKVLITADWEERPIIKSASYINIGGKKHLLETFVDITDRKLAEEALQKSEEEFRTLIENLNVGIYRNAPSKSQFVQANPAMAKIFGYKSLEEFLKISADDLYQNSEDRKLFVQDVKSRGSVKNKELALKKKDGTPIWCSSTATLKYDKKGEIQWLDGIVEDITQRKKAEEEKAKLLHDLNERVKELNCLHNISRLIDIPGIALEEILQSVANLIPFSWQYPEITCARIIFENIEFKTSNFKNTKLKQSADIKVYRKKTGKIEVYLLEKKFKDSEKPFLKEENTLLQTIAEQLGKTVERLKINEALRQNEHFLQTLINAIPNPIFYKDIHGVYQGCNAAFEAYLGLNKSRIIGKSVYDVAPKELADKYHEMDMKLLHGGGIQVYESSVRYADATVHDVIFNKATYTNTDGSVSGLVGVILDITERKQTEKALREAEEDWHRTFDSISDLVFIMDNNFVITRTNKAFCDALKAKPEDIIGKKCYELLHKTDAPWPNCPFEKTKGDQKVHVEEIEDKNIGVPLLVTTSPIFNENGELIGSVHLAKDISEIKKTQEELTFKNVLLTTQQEVSIDGILIVDAAGKIISFNQRFVEMWDIPQEVIESKSDERSLQLMLKQLEDPIPFLAKVRYLYEHRNETSRDEIALIDGRTFDRYSAPMFGDKGKYYGRVWYFRDVTDQKQAEEKLMELSLMDELTGLNNRRGFSVLAAKQMKNADRYKHGLTLLYIDLDNMKWINDNLGHKEGDQALKDVSNIFKNSFRASDIIGRLGGDEFAGLVVDSRGTTSDMILSRMQEGINELNSQKIRPYTLSISYGAIPYDHEKPCSLNELLEQADKAMYAHKQKKGMRRGENVKPKS